MTGPDGPVGDDGEAGDTGPSGPRGERGDAGPDGLVGLPGNNGQPVSSTHFNTSYIECTMHSTVYRVEMVTLVHLAYLELEDHL